MGYPVGGRGHAGAFSIPCWSYSVGVSLLRTQTELICSFRPPTWDPELLKQEKNECSSWLLPPGMRREGTQEMLVIKRLNRGKDFYF